jgi:hypothetical protein
VLLARDAELAELETRLVRLDADVLPALLRIEAELAEAGGPPPVQLQCELTRAQQIAPALTVGKQFYILDILLK